MSGTVRIVRPIRARRDALWRACSTEAGLSAWYADRVSGVVRQGRPLRLEWPDLGAGVELDVVELVPEERIAFDNGESRVTLQVGDGSVTLCHEGLGVEEDLDGFRSSWRLALAHLAHTVEAHGEKERRATWVVRTVKASPELVHLYFTDPDALAAWLGRGARIGGEGEVFSIDTGAGGRISGRVLVRETGRDVAFTWQERGDSVLALRTLPSPASSRERALALCWSTWGAVPPDEAAARVDLEAAADRLVAALGRSGTA